MVAVAVAGEPLRLPQMPAPATAVAAPSGPADQRAPGEEMAGDGTISENDIDDEGDGENWLRSPPSRRSSSPR